MGQFSLKQLLLGVLLIGGGIGTAAQLWRNKYDCVEFIQSLAVPQAVALLILPGAMIGSGFCVLLTRRPLIIGAVALLFAVLGAFIQWIVYSAQFYCT
jgi:hypothetical protein